VKYVVREKGPSCFRLWVDGAERPINHLTAKDAKAHCWSTHGVVPVQVFEDEGPFSPADNALHLALQRIEARHSGLTEIVAVGSEWYLVRKSRFGAEFKVQYDIRDGVVYARHDFEPVTQEKETPA
jgi:hypothetical protein